MTARALPAPVARWWAGKSGPERGVVGAVVIAVAVAAGWLLLWQPLTRDVAAMRADRIASASALAAGERTAAAIAGLARMSAAAPAGDVRADAERALAASGVRALATGPDVADGRVRITFAAVPFAVLVAALEALERDARLRLVEATLTPRIEAGTVRAELTLAR